MEPERRRCRRLHDYWRVLAFVKSPNFEAPGDTGTDNIYDVMVEALTGPAMWAGRP